MLRDDVFAKVNVLLYREIQFLFTVRTARGLIQPRSYLYRNSSSRFPWRPGLSRKQHLYSSKSLVMPVPLTETYCEKSSDWFATKQSTRGYSCSLAPGQWLNKSRMTEHNIWTYSGSSAQSHLWKAHIQVTKILHSLITDLKDVNVFLLWWCVRWIVYCNNSV